MPFDALDSWEATAEVRDRPSLNQLELAHARRAHPVCSCAPGGPCRGAECDVCWRIPGCEARDAAGEMAAAKQMEDEETRRALARIAGVATLAELDRQDTVSWSVCVCADGRHGIGDRESFPTEDEARQNRLYVGGSHLVVRTQVVLTTAPKRVA